MVMEFGTVIVFHECNLISESFFSLPFLEFSHLHIVIIVIITINISLCNFDSRIFK